MTGECRSVHLVLEQLQAMNAKIDLALKRSDDTRDAWWDEEEAGSAPLFSTGTIAAGEPSAPSSAGAAGGAGVQPPPVALSCEEQHMRCLASDPRQAIVGTCTTGCAARLKQDFAITSVGDFYDKCARDGSQLILSAGEAEERTFASRQAFHLRYDGAKRAGLRPMATCVGNGDLRRGGCDRWTEAMDTCYA